MSLKKMAFIALVTGFWSLAFLWIVFSSNFDDVPSAKADPVQTVSLCFLSENEEFNLVTVPRSELMAKQSQGYFLPDGSGRCYEGHDLGEKNSSPLDAVERLKDAAAGWKDKLTDE